MERWIYNGDLLDKTGAIKQRPLVLNRVGMHENALHRTIREQGRADYTFLFVVDGEFYAKLGNSMQKYTAGTLIVYPPFCPQDYYQNGGAYAWAHITGEEVGRLVDIAFGDERVINFKPHREIIAYFERLI